jgi:hypothetical protein
MTDRKIIQIAFGSNGWTLHALADDGTLWRALHNWDWELCPNIPQGEPVLSPDITWLREQSGCADPRVSSPKPPSLKEQALKELAWVDEHLDMPLHNHCNAIHTIRRALEALPE